MADNLSQTDVLVATGKLIGLVQCKGKQLLPYGICLHARHAYSMAGTQYGRYPTTPVWHMVTVGQGRGTDRLVRAMASCSSCRACCCCTCFLFSRSISSSSRSVCTHHNASCLWSYNKNNQNAFQPGLGACGASLSSPGRLVVWSYQNHWLS